MIYMCKVYAFPVKKEFPKELEERLDKVSREYIKIIEDLVDTLYDDEPTEEDYQECILMIAKAYAKSLEKAFEEMD